MTPQPDILTAESTALVRFVNPVAVELEHLGDAITINNDTEYAAAAEVLKLARAKRTELTKYFKEEPVDSSRLQPGEGMVYFTLKAWQSANALFNRFDARLEANGKAIDTAMKKYREEQAALARMEAEAKAEAERVRLKAEADERERLAKIERDKAEAERQERLKAEQAAARTKADQRAAQERAEAERRRLEQEEAERQQRAQAELAKAQQRVVAHVDDTPPVVAGLTVKKVWKGRVFDLKALCVDIAAGKAAVSLIEPNESALNKLAEANQGEQPPNGVMFYPDESTRRTRSAK